MRLNLYYILLNVNNVLPTPYKDRKMKIFSGFDDVDVDEKRKPKDERRRSKKNRRKKKVNSKQRALVPNTKFLRKRALP